MNVGFITPSGNSGCTVAMICSAIALSLAQNEAVLMTATGADEDLKEYLDIEASSSNFGQVIKLLESGVINAEEVKDYSVMLSDTCNYLNVCAADAPEEVKMATFLKLLKIYPAEYKLIDIQDGFDSELTRTVMDKCDILVSVCSTYNHSYDVLKEWREHDLWPKGKNELLVVNNYDPEVAAVKYYSAKGGYPDSATCKIHYNPYIVKMCNKGQLESLVQAASELDPRVMELSNDFREIAEYITSINLRPMKWNNKGGK